MRAMERVEERRPEAARLIRYALEVRRAARELAEFYARGMYTAIVDYARRAWGYVPPFDLAPGPIDYQRGAASTVLASIILEHYVIYREYGRMKNVIVSLVGMGGSGKTTYALLSCIGALMLSGADWRRAVDIAGRLIYFDLESFIEGVEGILESNIWVPCIIADDVGEWMPKYWRDIGMTGVVHFFNLLDQAKDWVGVMVFTARSFKGSIAKNIRDKSDYIVEAREEIIEMHRLDVFKWYTGTDWSEKETKQKLKRMLYLDPMPSTAMLPGDVWDRMMETRRRLAEKSLAYLRSLIEALPAIERERIEKIRERYAKTLGRQEEDGAG